MSFLKTSFWSAITTVIKMLAGIITTKIMAIYVGPVGIALLGNFNNVAGVLSTFANGAVGVGATKYISEFESETGKKKVVSHTLKITVISSLLIGISVIIFHEFIALLIFDKVIYSSAIIIFGLTILFFGLNITISAVLNGYKQVKYMVIVGIIGSILSMILAFVITIKYGLFGALINSSISQVIIFAVNIKFISKLKLFDLKMILEPMDKSLSWKLFKYALMSMVSAFIVPISTLMIRKYILNNFMPQEAGYVQGLWSISSMYLMIVTTTLSIYYLPTLSSIRDWSLLRREVLKGYSFLLPIAILGGLGIFIFKDLIISILYTPEFLPMKDYFMFQIIGDSFKIASWILGYLMVAKAMTRLYIITEILFSSLYVALSFTFMNYFGSIGVTYAYALNYFIFFVVLIIIFRNLLFRGKPISAKEKVEKNEVTYKK